MVAKAKSDLAQLLAAMTPERTGFSAYVCARGKEILEALGDEELPAADLHKRLPPSPKVGKVVGLARTQRNLEALRHAGILLSERRHVEKSRQGGMPCVWRRDPQAQQRLDAVLVSHGAPAATKNKRERLESIDFRRKRITPAMAGHIVRLILEVDNDPLAKDLDLAKRLKVSRNTITSAKAVAIRTRLLKSSPVKGGGTYRTKKINLTVNWSEVDRLDGGLGNPGAVVLSVPVPSPLLWPAEQFIRLTRTERTLLERAADLVASDADYPDRAYRVRNLVAIIGWEREATYHALAQELGVALASVRTHVKWAEKSFGWLKVQRGSKRSKWGPCHKFIVERSKIETLAGDAPKPKSKRQAKAPPNGQAAVAEKLVATKATDPVDRGRKKLNKHFKDEWLPLYLQEHPQAEAAEIRLAYRQQFPDQSTHPLPKPRTTTLRGWISKAAKKLGIERSKKAG